MSYKILVKFPTRNRPSKFLQVLKKCIDFSIDKEIKYLISFDYDDPTMTEEVLNQACNLSPGNILIFNGISKNKIDACNRDMEKASAWDIALLVSDDMEPQQKGWDEIIKKTMNDFYPDTDGVLFFNDGFQGERLNTLCIVGKKYYDRFNYFYNPEYIGFYCDNEFMDVAYKLNKQKYFSQVLFKHQHPFWTSDQEDELYVKNKHSLLADKFTFDRRSSNNFYLKNE